MANFSSWLGVLIGALVVFPAAVAMTVYRNVSDTRSPPTPEERLWSLLLWCGLVGWLPVVLMGELDTSAADLLKGTPDIADYGLIAALFVLWPVVLGLVTGGIVSRRDLKQHHRLKRSGALSAQSYSPWDWMSDDRRRWSVKWTEAGVEYIGDVVKADTEGQQILVNNVARRIDYEDGSEPEWQDMANFTGALLVNFGERALWYHEEPKDEAAKAKAATKSR